MQFQVPQFIEVEDKIFGPLTFRQFVYLVGGAGGCYLVWRVLPSFLALPIVVVIGGLALALAFVTYNNRPFIIALENAFFYGIRSKFYLWDNQRKAKQQQKEVVHVADTARAATYIPKISDSRLHDLAWSLDIKERVAAGTARDEERGTDSVVPVRTAREARI